MASSFGALTLQFDTRTLRHESMSKPSRLVSTRRLSIVKLSMPVASTPNHPPCRMEKSRSVTLRQFFSAMLLLPEPGPPKKFPPVTPPAVGETVGAGEAVGLRGEGTPPTSAAGVPAGEVPVGRVPSPGVAAGPGPV